MEGRAGSAKSLRPFCFNAKSQLLLVVSDAVPAASPTWCATAAPCAPAELDVDEENSLVHMALDPASSGYISNSPLGLVSKVQDQSDVGFCGWRL